MKCLKEMRQYKEEQRAKTETKKISLPTHIEDSIPLNIYLAPFSTSLKFPPL